jgi:hypothetical protein
MPEKLALEAKLTPSLSTSAMYVDRASLVKVDNQTFVEFPIEDRNGRSLILRRPLLNKMVTRTPSGVQTQRFRVQESFCLGGKVLVADVLLIVGSTSEQEVRIGRNELAGNVIVDPSRTHTAQPECEKL